MKKERIGELLRWYMREHKRCIWLVILLGVIYGSVFYLYNVPVEAAAYGTVLGVTFLLVMNVLWFWKFCRKHRKRMELIPGIDYAGGRYIGRRRLPADGYGSWKELL